MKTFAQHQRVLRNPSYRWFLSSSMLATLGNGLAYIALTWIVVQAHATPSAVAMLMICFWIAVILFSPLCGVIADRFHLLTLMILSVVLRGVMLVSCGFYLLYHHEIWIIYGVSFLNGMLFSLYSPAMLTFLRELIDKKSLLYANTQLDITYEVGNVIGMGMAGFVMAFFSPGVSLILNGGFFLLAGMLLLFVRYESQQEQTLSRSFATLYRDFLNGLRYLSDRPGLRATYSLQLLLFVQFMTWPVLLAPFARQVLHLNVMQFGEIEACFSLGVVVGGLFNSALSERIGFYRILLFDAWLATVAFYIFGTNHVLAIAAILCFFIGFSMSAWALMVTKAQEMTELNYQGRMQGTFSSLSAMIAVLLYTLVYCFADLMSVQALYGIEIIFTLCSVLLLVRYKKYFYLAR